MVAAPFPQDKRGFFIVPQHYEGGGYYVYGTPENGAGQYAHPDMMTFLSVSPTVGAQSKVESSALEISVLLMARPTRGTTAIAPAWMLIFAPFERMERARAFCVPMLRITTVRRPRDSSS